MFWQDEVDNLRGYPKHTETNHLMFVELVKVSRDPVFGSAGGTCGRIQRMLKKPLIDRIAKQLELLSDIEKLAIINANEWNIGYDVLQRLQRVIDCNCDPTDLSEFLLALKFSGVVYEDMNCLLSEIESFASEQGRSLDSVSDMDIDGADTTVVKAGKVSSTTSLDTVDLTLLCPCYRTSGLEKKSKHKLNVIASVCSALNRVENSSNILMWTFTSNTAGGQEPGEVFLDLIQIPRLKMNFHQKRDENGFYHIYSVDHSHLFITNFTSELTSHLMNGLPHSILLSSINNELNVLVPAIDIVRPSISNVPFSRELVYNRANTKWSESLETFYFLYPIHVSLSFMFTPTLSSSLYLLVCRFMNRCYDQVFNLVNTINTDVEFLANELNIFQILGRANGDNHPDAHACRLKINLVVQDAPISCPWNTTRQMFNYIIKLDCVSITCRLTLEEEKEMLATCVCDSDDPRFYDPATGQPLYSLYEVTTIKNRKNYLASVFSNASFAEVRFVVRQMGTRWMLDRNLTALALDEESISNIDEVQYAAPAQMAGHIVLDVAHQFWTEQEGMVGLYAKCGFLFIYELLTGTKTAKLLQTDISGSLAMLLFEFMCDKAEESLLPSILSIMLRFPYIRSILPKYKDNRSFKNTSVKASGTDTDPVSPLAVLLSDCLNVLQTEITTLMADYEMFEGGLSEPASTCRVDNSLPLKWHIPSISNFSCSKRTLSEISSNFCESQLEDVRIPLELELSYSQLRHFADSPLQPVSVQEYTHVLTRSERQLPFIDESLPFDISRHPAASTAVAVSMLERIERDTKEYAQSQNKGGVPKCKFVANPLSHVNILQSRRDLTGLLSSLEQLRDTDTLYVNNALKWLQTASNDIAISDLEVPPRDKIVFLMKRRCRLFATIWLEFLFGTVLSTDQFVDITKLNPYLSCGTVASLTSLIVSTILHANRVSQINRCIQDLRDLDSTFVKILNLDANFGISKDLHDEIILKEETLARNLTCKRYYISSSGDSTNTKEEEKRQRIVCMSYDPRFLLFEFTWSILLRKSQIEIVNDYISNVSKGVSVVKQMIMGAGEGKNLWTPFLTHFFF